MVSQKRRKPLRVKIAKSWPNQPGTYHVIGDEAQIRAFSDAWDKKQAIEFVVVKR